MRQLTLFDEGELIGIDENAPEIVRNAWKKAKQDIITGECGEQGHFAKNSRKKLPQKWLELFGGFFCIQRLLLLVEGKAL